jgi:hypothetical protein
MMPDNSFLFIVNQSFHFDFILKLFEFFIYFLVVFANIFSVVCKLSAFSPHTPNPLFQISGALSSFILQELNHLLLSKRPLPAFRKAGPLLSKSPNLQKFRSLYERYARLIANGI